MLWSGYSLVKKIMTPTTAQVWKCFQLCYDLTKKYCSIDLVTLDRRTGKIIILVREEINNKLPLPAYAEVEVFSSPEYMVLH